MGSTRSREPRSAASISRKAVILVLDDDPAVGTFVQSTLPEGSFEVVCHRDVAGAVAEIAKRRPDLALIDIGLDHGSGWDVVRHVRENSATARVPIVMITGSTEALDRERSLTMGADRYLVKPVSPEVLRRVVNDLLSARDDLWWTLNLQTGQIERLRELFYDETTEVATLNLVVDQLRRSVERGDTLQVYCLELEPLFRLGERDHWDEFDALRREFVRALHLSIAPLLGEDALIATSHSGANDFYVFSRGAANGTPAQTARELERLARELLRSITSGRNVVEEVAIFVGGTSTQPQPVFAPRVLYNAVREAKDTAERRETRYFHSMREKLIRAVRENAIGTVYQPVIDLRSLKIVGFEALSRGPAGTDIESPEVIFEIARDFDLVWELETACIENVAPTLTEICSRGRLFFNLESHFIQQIQQRGLEVFESFLRCRHDVVIEVTERSAIRDYRTFRRTLHELQGMGFHIAIDDCGSGYATLEAVAELKPDYLKVGHSLFHDLDKDPVRRRLVDLVARCAESIGAKTVAEAIETEEQLRITRELGIDFGQGYFFARPAAWAQIRDWQPTP